VGIAANEGGAREGKAVFRAYNVYYAVFWVPYREIIHAEIAGVLVEGVDLVSGNGVGDGLFLTEGGDVVVGHAGDLAGSENGETAGAEAGKGLRGSDFVAIHAVDVELCGAVGELGNDVSVPDFVEQGF
jgi:hypothetical protein